MPEVKKSGRGRPAVQVIPSKIKRGPAQVDLDKLEILCEMGATHEMIAAFFHITERTLQKLMKAHPDLAEVMRTGKLRGNCKLLQVIQDRLKKSDAVLIFTAKNRLQWTDKFQGELGGIPGGKPIEVKTKPGDTALLDNVLLTAERYLIEKVNDAETPESGSETSLPETEQ